MSARTVKNCAGVDAPPQASGVQGKIRVWVVDDSVVFRNPCVELLQQTCGFQCDRQFGSAEDLIAALRQGQTPDAILLDFRLPGMNGL